MGALLNCHRAALQPWENKSFFASISYNRVGVKILLGNVNRLTYYLKMLANITLIFKNLQQLDICAILFNSCIASSKSLQAINIKELNNSRCTFLPS